MKKLIIVALSFLQFFQLQAQIDRQNDTLLLPFYEDWTSGSFLANNWAISSSNWIIDTTVGNNAPCAVFNRLPLSQGYYSDTLLSTFVNADSLYSGEIWLNFDLKLDVVSPTGTEKFLVKVYNGSDWITILEKTNLASFDWEENHLYITYSAIGKDFRIMFLVNGEFTANIEGWYIDNIEIYRHCPSACGLNMQVKTFGETQYLVFTSQECEVLPSNGWVHWDNGFNINAIGSCTCEISVAARWPSDSLTSLEGKSITGVRVFAYDDGFTYWIIKIWQGDNADTLIYSEDVTNKINPRSWTEIILAENVPIDINKELWVGYRSEIIAGYFPLGTDFGPGDKGFGDKMSQDEELWENLSDYGWNYNWNIQFFAEDTTGREILNQKKNMQETTADFGIYLYQSVNGGDYQLLEDFQYSYRSVNIPKPSGSDGDLYCYKLTRYLNINGDFCESAPFTTLDGPQADSVCYLLTGGHIEQFNEQESIRIFPNPANKAFTVQCNDSEFEGSQIEVIDLYGRKLTETRFQEGENSIIINSVNWEKGFYLVKVTGCNGKVLIWKVLIN